MSDSSFSYRPVVFASDEKGALQLGVALYSLLTSSEETCGLRVVVLDVGIASRDREKIKLLCRRFDAELIWIGGLLARLDGVPYSDSFPPAACARILLPELLPGEKSALYVDIDVLFSSDISELLAMELGNFLAAAVYENETYFNSGVMLMNLDLMRKEGIQEQMFAAMKKHRKRLVFFDQDILNMTLAGRVLSLHPRWNWNEHYSRKLLKRYRHWGRVPFLEALAVCLSPCIRHFASRPKMVEDNYRWNRRLYRKVWLASPWADEPVRRGKRRWQNMWRRWWYGWADRRLHCRMRGILEKDAREKARQ